MKPLKTFLLFSVVVLVLANAGFAQNGRPLSLKECIDLALQNNSSVRNAERQMQVAGTNVMTARAALLPSVNTSFFSGKRRQGDQITDDIVALDYEKKRAPVFSVEDTTAVIGFYRQFGSPTAFGKRTFTVDGFDVNSNSARMNLAWRVFDFGQTWSNIRAANASEDASQNTYESVQQGTILLVQQRYFEHLKALRLLEVQQEAVKSNEEQLKRTESMYEIGSVAQGDVFKQRTVLGNTRISLIRQENAMINSRAALNVALGRDPEAELSIQDVEETSGADNYKSEEVLNVAMEKNPELKSLQMRMRSSELQAKAAKLAYLPSVTLSASYDRQNPVFDRVYGTFDKNYSFNYGVSVNFNLFNGFSDQAQVERQSLNYQIANENLVDRERNLRLEVKQALLTLQAAKEITTINEDNSKSAEEDLRLAQERYRVGAGTLLDIITAQVNVTNAKATLVNAKYDMMIARAQLKAAMGTLEK